MRMHMDDHLRCLPPPSAKLTTISADFMPDKSAICIAVGAAAVQTPIRGLLSSTYVRGAVTLRSSLDGSGRCISMQPGGSVICNVDNHSVDEIIRLVAVTNLHRPDNLLFIDPSL